MSDDVAKLTRTELYEQVWTTPMRRLAPQYGLSDVGLAKIYEKLNIPRPPVGLWAKKEGAKAPAQPKLPDTDGHGHFWASAPDGESRFRVGVAQAGSPYRTIGD